MSHLHLFVIPGAFNYLYSGSIVLLTIWRGRWRERTVALAWAFPDFLFPGLIRFYLCSQWCLVGHPPLSAWLSLSCDVFMLGVCALVAARADRYWTIWAGAFAFLSVLTDVLAAVLPGLTYWAYISADQVWWLAIGAATAWGCIGDVGDRKARP
jgi:hypothetical protein